MANIGFSGGDALEAKLKEIAERAGAAGTLRMGFLENATYPDGQPVAAIAALQEYGGTIDVPERETTIYRQVDADGDFKHGGRFVKAKKSNFATTHTVPAHKITIPARPFFRYMIEHCKAGWGPELGKIAVQNNYDMKKSLGLMGEHMAGQLQQTIGHFDTVPLAKSTIARKGFNTPLIDSGHMQNSVDYEVNK